ncbi:cytochrome P450-like protein [Trypanosoma rangeli]|uniref:sterol 22-desaturase n=1 Tax=Trypanosoma rangeli TaxID=5698 RepID=A0A3S5IRG8_TRYRA|nr:cytochrome P450-like protein [Trypanosoma rangeli]RNF06640.1 cytochrome P450-like protein [Trypanosoma rangeli]|eukprot:RNF06640.1 cytochrome P450-like protein [Trypanosoma rangeli]
MAVFNTVLGVHMPHLVEVALLVFMVYGLACLVTMLYFATKHKFSAPGPMFVTPLLGGLGMMIRDPFTFWEKQRFYSPNGYSWQAILTQFVLFVTNADLCHKIFATNSEGTLSLQLHPNGRVILGDNNIAFQSGPQHKALRASFMNLFTTKALSLYLPIQERLIREHLAEWVRKYPFGGKPEEMRNHIREMNCKTSQTIFLGEHLHNCEEFTRNYNVITVGFLSLPIYFPGTALYKAVHARKKVVDELTAAVGRSKAHMSLPDAEAHCLLDFWSATILEIMKASADGGEDPPPFTSDHAMADTMLDFLFASQDASTASLTMITATMADRPDILERVRQEQERLRVGDEPLTNDVVQEMAFTRQCVLEQLRLFPPAPMVPMKAHSDFVIDDHYTVPKGSLVIPSLVGACRGGFTNPNQYDPDRMGPERQEDRKFSKHFIPFGVGPHRCVGYNYAINHITIYLATIAQLAEWKRTRTPRSDEVLYLPTLYPRDCLCTWRYRESMGTKEQGV